MAGRTGRYDLHTRIAAGGMGEVYVAADTTGPPVGRKVALKLLLPHLSEEQAFVDMFLDEARITARLHHPNIPQVLDVGLADGRYFLAIELIEGVSASQLLRACRRAGAMLPLPVIRLIARGLCEALDYAHGLTDDQGKALDVVHRDVSPSNLLLARDGRVLLNDFGIARARGKSHATRTGEVKGKFAYMPPEQLDLSAPVDRRADVYSAALTLYELASLESPYLRESEAATIDAVRAGALPDVTLTRADVTPGFAAALVRASARRPAERFPTARALLEAVLDGPVAPAEELGKLVESLCPQELEVFHRPAPEVVTRASVETSSMRRRGAVPPLEANATAAAIAKLQPPWWRWLAALTATGAVLGGLVGWWQLSPSRESTAAVPAVAPPPPPEVPPAKPVAVEVPAVARPVVAAPVPVRVETPVRRPKPAATPVAKPSPVAVETPAAPAAPTAPGWLSLDASPWAQVFIDGREVDRTPIARYPLPPGHYRVVFKNPERGREVTREVTVESGKPTSVLVNLE